MSLKTDFYDGSTGLNQQMDAAFAAGSTYVTNNLVVLSDALKSNAAQGLTSFTVKVSGVGSMNAAYLRAANGNNLLLKSFFAGITAGLAGQAVYSYECALTLDVSDSVNTNVNFGFSF